MEMSRDGALERLHRWKKGKVRLGTVFSAPGGITSVAMLAQITEVSARLVLANDSTSLAFTLKGAQYEYGPLQVLPFPLKWGESIAISHLPRGLVSVGGLHIRLESGHFLFLSDSKDLTEAWKTVVGGAIKGLGSGRAL